MGLNSVEEHVQKSDWENNGGGVRSNQINRC